MAHAAEAAAQEARRVMRERRKAEVTEEVNERIAKLKDRISVT